MTDIDYNGLRVLVADDFSNFRTTVANMLNKLGVHRIYMAKDGTEAIEWCGRTHFDVIMCDHDLGDGKNGQQVLEELRHRELINKSTLFLLVSADASKSVVMSAYDCEPDDYLTKPFNAQILLQRLNRLLTLRNELLPVYQAIDNGNVKRAISILTELAVSDGRHAIAAQKLLGHLFIAEDELPKAEKLYKRALASRQVDWARLGLAKVKQLQKELDVSGEWLEKIVADNPLYLPAYDVLAQHWEHLGQPAQVQDTIQRSVNISPKSILRQQRLAKVADENGDRRTAFTALKSVVKLGEQSCHGRPEDSLDLAKMALEVVNLDDGKSTGVLPDELIETLAHTLENVSLTAEQHIQAGFLEARLYQLDGKKDEAKESFESTIAKSNRSAELSVETEIAKVEALQDLGEADKADQELRDLIQRHNYDEAALEKLDSLLSEPVSESNRARVAVVNREGIELYDQGLFDESIACFEKAKRSFPKHVGIQLNMIQAYIGKLKNGGEAFVLGGKLKQALMSVRKIIDSEHSQFKRYEQLKIKADKLC